MTDGTAAVRKRKLLRGPGAKDDRKPRLRARTPALQVELCQILPTGDDSALLRIAGRWPGPPPADVHLRVDDDDAAVEAVAPGPAIAPDGLWSAGFEVPMTAADAELALVAPVGATPLPRPAAVAGAHVDLNAELADARVAAGRLEQRCELNERELAEMRGKLVEAWGEVASMRETLNARAAEYENANRIAGQAAAMVGELEARAEHSEAELDVCRRELEGECERLRGELAGHERAAASAADLLDRFEAARTRAGDLETHLEKARSVAEDAMEVATRAARELLAERAKVDEANALADRSQEALARAEHELSEAREQLAAMETRVAGLEAGLEAAQRRIERAERESAAHSTELAAAQAELANAEARIGEIEAESTTGRQELAATKTRVEELDAELSAAHAALTEAEAESATGREELAATKTRVEQLEGELSAAQAALTLLEAESITGQEELATMKTRVEELEGELATAREQLQQATHATDQESVRRAELEERFGEAVARSDRLEAELGAAYEEHAQARARVEQLEGELATAREQLEQTTHATDQETAQLAELEERFGKAVARADALEAELAAARDELAAKTGPEVSEGGRSPGRRKVPARVHAEALEKLGQEQAERQRAEKDAAQLAERVRELESEVASYHERRESPEVEEDLRHLLAARQRELDAARTELQEQRARYAAVASKMSPDELAATTETSPPESGWTALDDDLLNRLARAKQLSSQSD